MNGILVVDKPKGWTSFDVIAKLRGALHTKKIGHSGTLDPLATGVLPLFIGAAVKAVDMPQNHIKTYIATIKFGIKTPTADLESEPCETQDVQISEDQLKVALCEFLGETEQLPPMFSAVKVNGQPLYKAARKGVEIERKARKVTISEIKYLEKVAENEYSFSVTCSKGTYIRVLVEDIAKTLNTIGVMTSLRRTVSGDFKIENSYTLEAILQIIDEKNDASQAEKLFINVDSVFGEYPRIDATQELRDRLLNGCTTHINKPAQVYRIYSEDKFMGLAEVENKIMKVKKLFVERG